jgi:hypothetical protein
MPALSRPLSGSREMVAAEVMYLPASSSWWTRNGSSPRSMSSPVRTTSCTGACAESTSVVGTALPSRLAYSSTMPCTSLPIAMAMRS